MPSILPYDVRHRPNPGCAIGPAPDLTSRRSHLPAKPQLTDTYNRRWATLVVLCFSIVIIGMDNTILNVAIPTLHQELNADSSTLQWIATTYVLVFAGFLLLMASLADRLGRAVTLRRA